MNYAKDYLGFNPIQSRINLNFLLKGSSIVVELWMLLSSAIDVAIDIYIYRFKFSSDLSYSKALFFVNIYCK